MAEPNGGRDDNCRHNAHVVGIIDNHFNGRGGGGGFVTNKDVDPLAPEILKERCREKLSLDAESWAGWVCCWGADGAGQSTCPA